MTGRRLLGDADERCGRKAATLGVLLRNGFAVPPGFVITDPDDDRWTQHLAESLVDLGPGPYAVRSSALTEDGTDASFAGQLHTTLQVPSAGAVIDAVARTAASGRAAAPMAYASRLGGRPTAEVCPVLVQQMITPDSAGVLFTRHPVTGAKQTVIEAITGLGDGLADGSVTPERWTVDDAAVLRDAGPASPVLTAKEVRDLAALGRRIEALLASPQDIEWAVADGQVWVLQARPITAVDAPHRAAAIVPRDSEVLVTGTAASPGVASGEPKIITGLDDFARFAAGDVLVCRTTSPAWTPLLARAAAVVTETGGMLAHAAIVAREFGIPAVLAADDAMTLLTGRGTVVVDGSRGLVASAVPAQAPSRGGTGR